MNAREMVRRALEGKSVARNACGPLAVHVCARLAGIPLSEFSTRADRLADAVVRYFERFRPDAVWISADTWVTAEAMGAKVAAPGPDEPLSGTGEPAVKHARDVDRLPRPDPHTRGRQPVILEALRKVRSALGDEAFIVGCFDQSPFSLACALAGIETVLLKTVEDPSFVEALTAKAVEHVEAYGEAMAAAGADMLSTGDSPALLLGPEGYERFALPGEREVFHRLHRSTALPLSLHICGDTTALLPLMATAGADVLEVDHGVDLARATAALPPALALWGNLDPVALLLRGTAREVEYTARRLIESMDRAGRRRFVLSSGCTLAPDTPPENIQALLRAARGPGL